jgi:hypothetical protein
VGPASILSIIDYDGCEGDVAGSNEYAKQNTLASEAGTTEGGSNTLDLKNVLNDYWSGIRTLI